MPAFVTFGRILFAVLFIYTGATKLFAIQATADAIAAKVVIPAVIAPYAAQLETVDRHGHCRSCWRSPSGALRDHRRPDDRAEFRRAVLRDPADHLHRLVTVLLPRFLEPDAARQRQDAGRRAEEPVARSARCS